MAKKDKFMKKSDKPLINTSTIDDIIKTKKLSTNNIVSCVYNSVFINNGSTKDDIFEKVSKSYGDESLFNYTVDKLIECGILKEEEGKLFHTYEKKKSLK